MIVRRSFPSLLVLLAAALALALAGSGSAASISSGSARLTKTSFSSSQASSVKLVCKFPKTVTSFSYKLSLKSGKNWKLVRSGKQTAKKGACSIPVKKLFGSKAVKLGSYQLKLSVASKSKTLSFKVVKASGPTGSAPSNTALPTITGTPKDGTTLTAQHGSWNGSPAPSFAYRWQRCDGSGSNCSDISGATSTGYVVGASDYGRTLRVVVTASNSSGSASATSAQSAAAGASPLNTSAPTITGTARQGNTLTGHLGVWTGYPAPTLSVKWQRCDGSGSGCSTIAGAGSSNYTLVTADDDHTIKLVVTATNSFDSVDAGSVSPQVKPIVLSSSNGDSHGCAVLSDGKVECWGDNEYGQLGDGTTDQRDAPVLVTGISTATQVAAGGYQTCALLADTSVWCWGYAYDGELGDGLPLDTNEYRDTPVQVVGTGGTGTWLTGVTQISVGEDSACALRIGGVVCWGYDGDGDLGDELASGSGSSKPVVVRAVGGAPGSSLANIIQISSGGDFSCATSSGGNAYCWGYNAYGQLGSNNTSDYHSPVEVVSETGSGALTGVVEVTAGYESSCAVTSASGTAAWCWGYDGDGELGNGATGGSSSKPVHVLAEGGTGNLNGITNTVVGFNYGCALTNSGGAYCWGNNGNGQLGDGERIASATAVQVASDAGLDALTGAQSISAGGYTTCAVLSDSSLSCWGYNFYGQLGIGSRGYSLVPLQVGGIAGATQVSTGGLYTCAVVRGSTPPGNNTLWCWGYNVDGQLGNGTTTNSSIPVQVMKNATTPLTGVTEVAVGGYHTCALTSATNVWCWGYGYAGQLGDGSTGSVPSTSYAQEVVDVGGSGNLSGVSEIGAGWNNTCALASGTVYCWGYNYAGQLGQGYADTGNHTSPLSLSVPSGVTQLSVGANHSCAVVPNPAHLSDPTYNTLWCWGQDDKAQVGNGSFISLSSTPDGVWSPSQVVGPAGPGSYLTGVESVSAGYHHTCALLSTGKVSCWGGNDDAETGIGYGSSYQFDPVTVISSAGPPPVDVTGASAVSAGGSQSCAVLTGGALDCWGGNGYGQVGLGDWDNPVTAATAVSSLTNVIQVSTGGSDSGPRHTCAVNSDHTVWCWGSDYYGQLGDGGVGYADIPTAIVTPPSESS